MLGTINYGKNLMNNLHPIDRFARALVGIAMLELGYFWLSGGLQIGAYVVGVVLIGTALVKFCPLYSLIGLRTGGAQTRTSGSLALSMAVVVLLTAAVGGSFASSFFSRKVFLEDFNVMNDHYKQTLFLTGKNERAKANAKYDLLIPAYAKFQEKYSSYRPYALKNDTQLSSDLVAVQGMLKGVNDQVRSGDLHEAHLALEKVRPVFQEVFKRNGFSMLAVALVDFHDAMELMLDAATAKNADKLIELYPQVSDKLKAIEAEANDAEIQTIRKNLDALLAAATAKTLEALPASGDALKTSFVKVYLQRG
ncbi:hypothetical protein DIC66_13825 [Rhodoferax lacus]|uniref:Inner membrane protein YgaP-like transmembrane domain-containing protein n=2 Tax=Rhodoferax lacus TaxID=2184758 RepID=A0A3E1RCM2_9BURK|nr:hypothetical protein DIC66_13825 [Rhodoferax lacus]